MLPGHQFSHEVGWDSAMVKHSRNIHCNNSTSAEPILFKLATNNLYHLMHLSCWFQVPMWYIFWAIVIFSLPSMAAILDCRWSHMLWDLGVIYHCRVPLTRSKVPRVDSTRTRGDNDQFSYSDQMWSQCVCTSSEAEFLVTMACDLEAVTQPGLDIIFR